MLVRIDGLEAPLTYGSGLADAGSVLLSGYGRELAVVMVWAIGILFVVGLFWEDFPKAVRLITAAVGWLGIALVIFSAAFAIYDILARSTTTDAVVVSLSSFGSAVFGLLFFMDVVRGASSNAQLERSERQL